MHHRKTIAQTIGAEESSDDQNRSLPRSNANGAKRCAVALAFLGCCVVLSLVILLRGVPTPEYWKPTLASRSATMPAVDDAAATTSSFSVAPSTNDTLTLTSVPERSRRNNPTSRPTAHPKLKPSAKMSANKPTTNPPLLVTKKDYIYRMAEWDSSPIVVERHRLVFFAVPKVGCTAFKQLFRRMEGFEDWQTKPPHDPHKNGLKYLFSYNLTRANDIMTDSRWTRAIFVRDPRERLLSAYLDKGARKHGDYVWNHCCRSDAERRCGRVAHSSFKGFLRVAKLCVDQHWRPQSLRMDEKYWPYVNFVGRFEHASDDAKQMILSLDGGKDAWRKYGATGWGPDGTEAMFATGVGGRARKHATDAKAKVSLHYTDETERMAQDLTKLDYSHPWFNFTQ